MTLLRLLPPGLLAGLVLGATAGPARAQTVGTYSYYWTDAADTPITAASVTAGDALTVRLWIRETDGTAFTTNGLGGYDATVSWANGDPDLLRFGGAANNTQANPNVRLNPYPAGGFTGPGAVRNNQIEGINANRTFNAVKSVQAISDPSTYVKDTPPPNTDGTVLLMELVFQTGPGTGSTTLVGGQNPNLQSYTYALNGTTPVNLDSAIGGATASLAVTVTPVLEPAGVLATAGGLLALAGVRRRLTAGPRAAVPRGGEAAR